MTFYSWFNLVKSSEQTAVWMVKQFLQTHQSEGELGTDERVAVWSFLWQHRARGRQSFCDKDWGTGQESHWGILDKREPKELRVSASSYCITKVTQDRWRRLSVLHLCNSTDSQWARSEEMCRWPANVFHFPNLLRCFSNSSWLLCHHFDVLNLEHI